MDNSDEIFTQIKILCSSITESTYDNGIQQCYKLLIKLHDLGLEKKSVYQSLLQYHRSLEDSISRDFVADIMDFVVGWCSPQSHIWKEN